MHISPRDCLYDASWPSVLRAAVVSLNVKRSKCSHITNTADTDSIFLSVV